ncbi:MAG: DUF3307 domain-containing protein [Roseinatronobacter sp.]
MSAGAILLAMALFQLKHYLADFHWQSPWMLANKGSYGHPGGMAHAGMHGALSLPVLVFAAPGLPALIVILMLAEIVAHYHIDWIKARSVDAQGLGATDQRFWRFVGLDQAAHQVTYLAILASIVALAGA